MTDLHQDFTRQPYVPKQWGWPFLFLWLGCAVVPWTVILVVASLIL